MFTITKFEYRQRSGVGIGGVWKDEPLWYAEIEVNKNTLCFSRFDTETDWFCDTHFRGSIPVFHHGEGNRSCAKQSAKGDLKAELDKRKASYTGQLKKVYGVA